MAQINAGDTAWVLISAALVLLMTPGLAFFYGGMVRKKNVLATLMQSFIMVALITVQWALWGYTLAFGPDKGGIIGGLDWFGLLNVGLEPNATYAPTIPHSVFVIFQGMFAIITPALITGAFAERMKFRTFIIFSLLWATLVYDPLTHWIWADGGWLRRLGALDFAGGAVVHISSGFAALAAALAIRRRTLDHEPEAHDLTMTLLGVGLLWFGWFGFNAGSALSAGSLAANAFLVTNISASMGALVWMTMSWMFGGKPSVLGAASGAVAGLGGITPAAGYVTASAAMVIGLVAGVLCYLACRLRLRARVDDSLDVWGVHGVCGTWGILATGLFATVTVNAAGANGLFYGNPGQLGVQALTVVVTWGFSFGMTFVILKVLDALFGLTVDEQEELDGLDVSQHGEPAYQLGGPESAPATLPTSTPCAAVQLQGGQMI